MEDQLPDDGLKWFGEGFDGFPKRLPDDCVEYVIHVVHGGLNSTAALRTRLNEILKAATESKKKLLKDYIWQRQEFDLTLQPKIDLSKPDSTDVAKTVPHLRGRTDFGDSIADEWLIVYLLHELSKNFPDVWLRVYDTDGEFLLIEAANSLPKWLNPEVSENRVWINDGQIKIIPLDKDSPPRNLTSEEALSFIRRTPEKLLVDPNIEKESFHRLRQYPSAISSSFHHTLITIPRLLAYLLHRNPSYISPAIEAFYLRDPVSLKPLATKDTNTLNFPPEDFVTVSVKFTKVGFAQLRSQLFDPPPAWTGIIPRMQDPNVAIGMKLTCGFEMLVGDQQNQDKRTVREIKLLLEDIDGGEEELPTDAEIKDWSQKQDDEKWLDIDYNDFEKELEGKSGAASGKGAFGDQAAQDNLRKMVSQFEDFLEDDEAGANGVDDIDDDDDEENEDDDSTAELSKADDDQPESEQPTSKEPKVKDFAKPDVEDEPEEKQTEFNAPEALEDMEFERAIHDTTVMPDWHLEKSGLLDEARRLALEDEGDMSDMDEDEEMRKVIQLMEQELKGHGALNLENGTYKKVKSKGKGNVNEPPASKDKPTFGPARPPNMSAPTTSLPSKKSKSVSFTKDTEEEEESADEEITPSRTDHSKQIRLTPPAFAKTGPFDYQPEVEDGAELSSDDEEFNDIDLGLAKNMLEAFKGQAGMSGPAGNLMRALGVQMPRDEDEEEES
ncbi:Putative Ecd family protein [Septoria linicola]|uniref:Ecd family protein n=1 Tax=Septoria linicola TaxID=215465 RepID=A0A9Q9EQF1_9PEZI|nr:putative Ecd family protein [Septoria linicola]USW59070.1 Putative Ecd family protein [Septoria linicola]